MAGNKKGKGKVTGSSSQGRSYVPPTQHVSSPSPDASDVPSPANVPHLDRPMSTPSSDASAPASSGTQKLFIMPRGNE